MDLSLRVVTQIPLIELWDETGVVTTARQRYLNNRDVAAMLHQGKVRFVVANVGDPLKWIHPAVCFDFWKTEAKHRIAETDRIFLEEFPDEYCFIASEWTDDQPLPIVLLEKYH